MVKWMTRISGTPSRRDMSSASWLEQLLEANLRQGAHHEAYTPEKLSMSRGPVNPGVAALYWGPEGQGGSCRSLATLPHDPESIRPKAIIQAVSSTDG
ncbi:hypothetical protein M9458_055662 [Cirrhinus mrigala]|uniref:Uncharacterized protein n=1 Tax=Cirrhinus mrigala TaxID=683832 RepID=A0ABD0MJ39_CIRMR